jgi:hypothetical protein
MLTKLPSASRKRVLFVNLIGYTRHAAAGERHGGSGRSGGGSVVGSSCSPS